MSFAFVGHAGQYTDVAAGLLHAMRARWYDPGTGQFMSVDPELAETGQPYAYAADDPVNATDPTGRLTAGICGSLTIDVGVGASSTMNA